MEPYSFCISLLNSKLETRNLKLPRRGRYQLRSAYKSLNLCKLSGSFPSITGFARFERGASRLILVLPAFSSAGLRLDKVAKLSQQRLLLQLSLPFLENYQDQLPGNFHFS